MLGKPSFRLRRALSLFGLCLGITILLEVQAAGQVMGYRPNVLIGQTAAGQILNRPTVSQYMQLAFRGPAADNGFGNFIATYQGIVRPQLEARQEREAQLLQLRQLQQQVAEIRSEFRNQQRPGQFTTGHMTRYRTHSHFYPRLDMPRQP